MRRKRFKLEDLIDGSTAVALRPWSVEQPQFAWAAAAFGATGLINLLAGILIVVYPHPLYLSREGGTGQVIGYRADLRGTTSLLVPDGLGEHASCMRRRV